MSIDRIELRVGQALRARKWRLATAESCTGGLIGHHLTAVSGSSDYYVGGVIAYANDVKTRVLGVAAEALERFGAVSEPVARAMARQAAQRSGADVAVSITGIAGPGGGTDSKPVGLVYIAVVIDGQCEVKECRFPPSNRHWVRLRSALTALNWVRLRLQD